MENSKSEIHEGERELKRVRAFQERLITGYDGGEREWMTVKIAPKGWKFTKRL